MPDIVRLFRSSSKACGALNTAGTIPLESVFIQGRELKVIKAEGKLAALEEKLAHYPNTVAMNGIGHTRWATHGVPAERNAHPHIGGNNELAIIHNGIIENFQELKEGLLAKGYVFKSETDTEVLGPSHRGRPQAQPHAA